MNHFIKTSTALLLTTVFLLSFYPNCYNTSAKPKNFIKLIGTTNSSTAIYKKWDITNDGIADVVKAANYYDADESILNIYINDQIVYTNTESTSSLQFWYVNLLRLKSGKIFFDISRLVVSESCDMHILYEYNNGNLVPIYDFMEASTNYVTHGYVTLEKVKGNTIYANNFMQFYTLGDFIDYTTTYTYKNGKIEQTSFDCSTNKTLSQNDNYRTVKRKIKVYKNPQSKKICCTLKKGQIIRISSIIYHNKKIYFKIKLKNQKEKAGYLPASSKLLPDKYYFKEASYSG